LNGGTLCFIMDYNILDLIQYHTVTKLKQLPSLFEMHQCILELSENSVYKYIFDYDLSLDEGT
jgi:hypothetical protein